MKYVTIPETECVRALPFYLAAEEFLADRMGDGEDDLLLMWRVAPTVIVGRNQTLDLEVDLDYCRREGIDVCRRRSGGGAVYADRDNIMFSYITAGADALAVTFRRYTSAVAGMLRSLGLDASDSSRNDIMIGDRKVSGNAFYHRGRRSIVHGTMLFDSDMVHMSRAITPSRAKLTRHRGVDSVESRVTRLSEHLTMGIDRFMDYARGYLCDGSVELTAVDCEEIERRAQAYRAEEWLRRNVQGGVERHAAVAGVGDVTACVDVDGENRIRGLDFRGDFMLLADPDELLLPALRDVKFDAESVGQALAEVNTENVIYGMTKEQLINLLF